MSQENQSCLRFSLEESLWFRKGQEVAELVSISLDPDITIQENDQYVTIRGSLELTGEYKCDNENREHGEETNLDLKYVQTVEEREEGVCQFSHRFPVDITIPNNRIQSIYDIDVVVESFDYTFPERSCIKLTSDLTIGGLYGEQQHDRAMENTDLELLHRNVEDEETGNLEQPWVADHFNESNFFEAEARLKSDEAHANDNGLFETFGYQAETEEFPIDLYGRPSRSERDNSEEKELSPITEINVTEINVTAEKVPVNEESSSSSSKGESASPQAEVKKKKTSKKKGMSLTEFFARKEEAGDEVAKLKVCIVQKGDTLDTLSERYDLSIQNLLRVNHLELNQDVHEGQVLYIPIVVAKK
ncbi:MAG: stage VI sporulation protein D [Bacillota bacterium]|nr:stage VI sporulation protein D [Bacillota bacterium]